MSTEPMLTIHEAVTLTGRSAATIRRRYRAGELAGAYKDPTDRTETIRIPLSALQAAGLLEADVSAEDAAERVAVGVVERDRDDLREQVVELRVQLAEQRARNEVLTEQLRHANRINDRLTATRGSVA